MPTRKPTKEKEPTASKALVVINLRLPETMLREVDAWTARMNEETLGPQWTRNDLLRTVIGRALKDRGVKGEP